MPGEYSGDTLVPGLLAAVSGDAIRSPLNGAAGHFCNRLRADGSRPVNLVGLTSDIEHR
ncbi:MAG: hypothetical protein U5J63_10565 [Fodinibius sp.]|nr:hypothetical protein [Fodinibius sp.]